VFVSLNRIPFLLLIGAAALYAQTAVDGRVLAANGSAIGGATVTISGPTGTAAGQSTYVAVTGSDAKYSFPALATGSYDITAAESEHRPQTRTVLLNGAHQQIDFVLDPACNSCSSAGAQAGRDANFWGTLVVVLLFLASIWLVRWHNIARPNRELLKAEIDKARARFQNETGRDLATDPSVKYLGDLLNSAERAVQWSGGTRRELLLWNWRCLIDFLFWSRGQEITGWARIHEFQRDTVKYFTAGSLEMVSVRLQAVELDLLDIDKTHAKALAANIKDALENHSGDESFLRALLVETLTYLNDESDNVFAQLVGWQTKAVWLAGVGCTLVVVLALAIGNSVLFIVGAAGGYLSRLARSLKRADVPSDYGASWTTLFLSPIVGALSGWFGILLIVLLADSKFQVLGAAFQQICWCCPLAPITLGMAFALGFSERLFDGIISSLEDKVDKDRQDATKPQQPTSTIQPAAAPDKTAGAGKTPDTGK
jgi:hypothetical protein